MENNVRTHEDIESHIRDLQAKKKELNAEAAKDKGVGLADRGYFDSDFYDGDDTNNKYEGYVTSIAPNDDVDDEEDDGMPIGRNSRPMGYTAPTALLNEMGQGEDYDPFAERRKPTVAEKEDEYRQKRRRLVISPERVDPFADGGKTPDVGSRSYTEIMREQLLKGEEAELRKKIQEKAKDGSLKISMTGVAAKPAPVEAKKRGRWDQAVDVQFVAPKKVAVPATPTWDAEQKTPADHRWDETPGHKGSETPGATPNVRIWDATPAHVSGAATTPGRETPAEKSTRRNRWDETPKTERETPGHSWAETPRADRVSGDGVLLDATTPASKRRSRWDETPSNATPSAMTPSIAMTPTPHGTSTPGHATPLLTPGGTTPVGHKAMAMATPTPGHLASMTPEQLQAYRWEKEIDERNRPFTDDELDVMFPPGYKVLPPPAGYIPIRTPARKLTATPTPIAGTPAAFFIQTEDKAAKFVDNQPKGNLPFMKPEDAQYFDKLLVEVDEDSLSPEE
uniref:Splicing factor 3B subunit 1 domain-containing protein n=1 Tax=Anopheles maculatus TaxID=74869 RepID=A0A182SDN7_9DIPT